ncbi:MAG TPA: isoprenylcysteine carboxylmethyltransferase family protein [Sphingomicrobium sp.]|jgi:methyltransferase
MIVNIIILALVTLQRVGELCLSNRNTRRLFAQGAHEHAPEHYPLIVALHAAWLIALWLLALSRTIDPFWLALFVFIELARIWTLASLGERWTTRIIVLPEAPLVRRGPYRWINHPNYWVVIAEIAVLPLVFGLWWVSLLFSLLNAALLIVRIHQENRALGR